MCTLQQGNTCTGIKSFSIILAVTITVLCFIQRASCAPLVRRSADNDGESISTDVGLIVHTINLRTKLHRLLTNYKTCCSIFSQGDMTPDVSASQVADIEEPVPNFSGRDSCASNDDILPWIRLPRADKMASHNDTLHRFRTLMDAIPNSYDNHIDSFLRDGGHVLFNQVKSYLQEIQNVVQELILTENLSGNSKLQLRNSTCEYDSSYSSSELDERFEVLYILQELHVYATGALSTIYMNDEVTLELVTQPDGPTDGALTEEQIYIRAFQNQS